MNLRIAPSADAPVVALLPDGAEVTELGSEASADGRRWRRVRTANGGEGWVSEDLLVRAGG